MKISYKIVLISFTVVSAFIFQSFITKKNDSDQIQFKKITLLQAKNVAKKEGKIIFIDANTAWCGPCKKMAATSFKDARVAKVFNSRFINLNIDMETNADGAEIEKTYKVDLYPTLLFINYKGKIVKKKIGLQSAEDLLAIAKTIK
jgi:thiol:disulfide interchange protein